MALYINGQADHAGAMLSFSVRNLNEVGDVVHEHEGWEIIFGNEPGATGVEIELRGTRYALGSSPTLIYNGREPHHEFYKRSNSNFSALVISETFIDSQLGSLVNAANFSFRNPQLAKSGFRNFARSIYDNLRTDAFTEGEAVALSEALVFEMIDSIPHDQNLNLQGLRNESLQRFLFKEIMVELHNGFRRSEFSLTELSLSLGVSKFHLIRTTKRIGGFTPHAYLQRLRLSEAKQLLLNSTESPSAIAILCGFDEISTFHKAFKKRFGIGPSTMRTSEMEAAGEDA